LPFSGHLKAETGTPSGQPELKRAIGPGLLPFFVIGDILGTDFRGVGEPVKANVVLTCIELSGLLLVIGVGVYAVLGGQGDASRLVEIDTGDSGGGGR
jgi:hypothetical protein